MRKNRSRSIFYHLGMSILLTGLLTVPLTLIDTAAKAHSPSHRTAIPTSASIEPILVAPAPRMIAPVNKTAQTGTKRLSKPVATASSIKPRSTGAIIFVSPPDQKPPQQVGGHGCSLVEAIYAANFDDNVAIDSINPDHF